MTSFSARVQNNHNINTTATQQQHNSSNTTSTQHQHSINTASTQHQHNSNTAATQHQHSINTASTQHQHNNNNNTIWRGSVLTGEEPPHHSGELNHALPRAGGPTQSQQSRPMSSGHHISMEHRLRRKQLNSDTNANNKTYLKEVQEKRKEETFFMRKMKKRKIKVKKRRIFFFEKK